VTGGSATATFSLPAWEIAHAQTPIGTCGVNLVRDGGLLSVGNGGVRPPSGRAPSYSCDYGKASNDPRIEGETANLGCAIHRSSLHAGPSSNGDWQQRTVERR